MSVKRRQNVVPFSAVADDVWYRYHRPPEWWRARGVPEPKWDAQPATLYEMGALTEAELAERLEFWKVEYERAWADDFCIANPVGDPKGQLTEGAAARREWLIWAAIPRSLRTKWDAERKRRAKAKLAEAAP